MVKIGLVGCGRWGRHILRDLKALGCWVAVVEPDAVNQAEANTVGADLVIASLDQLPAVTGCVVAVPTLLHHAVLLQLLGRACPIFCEKPLTADLAQAQQLVDLAGERIFVMEKWRYHAGVLALRDLAQGARLGPVLGLKTTRLQWGSTHRDVDTSWILLPHDLSIAFEILGYLPQPRHAVIESDQGGLLGLSAFLSGPAWLQCEIGIRSPAYQRRIELRCRDGIAVLADAYDTHLKVLHTDPAARSGAAPAWEIQPFAANNPLLCELEAFVAYLTGEAAPPKSTAREALNIVQTITTLHQLAQQYS
ncbi:MAG: Gfo/Idh/MocA family oxidoreductase [Pseudomonadota bacterium]